jgi:hypothetical protein
VGVHAVEIFGRLPPLPVVGLATGSKSRNENDDYNQRRLPVHSPIDISFEASEIGGAQCRCHGFVISNAPQQGLHLLVF